MNKTILAIRIGFIVLCAVAAWLVCYTIKEWDQYRGLAVSIGLMIGSLVILVDMMLKGFSLRGLSAITFGLAIGALIAWLIGTSPLLEEGDPQIKYLVRLSLFVICTYLGTVIALRGKDEFNLVIPYVRFVPHEVDVPLVVVDTSALIDGRIARIAELTHPLLRAPWPGVVAGKAQHVAAAVTRHGARPGHREAERQLQAGRPGSETGSTEQRDPGDQYSHQREGFDE